MKRSSERHAVFVYVDNDRKAAAANDAATRMAIWRAAAAYERAESVDAISAGSKT